MRVNTGYLFENDQLLATQGENKRAHYVNVNKQALSPEDNEIRKTLKKIFKVESLLHSSRILACYDEISGEPRPNYYQCLNGVYIVSCMYAKFGKTLEVPSYFLVRKLVGLRGGMVDWKFDFEFPYGITTFSACAVVPDDYQWSRGWDEDPYNHAVSTVTKEQFERFGIKFDTLVQGISSEVFKCDERFRPY